MKRLVIIVATFALLNIGWTEGRCYQFADDSKGTKNYNLFLQRGWHSVDPKTVHNCIGWPLCVCE